LGNGPGVAATVVILIALLVNMALVGMAAWKATLAVEGSLILPMVGTAAQDF